MDPEHAVDGQFPWMAAATWSYYDVEGFLQEGYCPGTIVAPTWMLTAARCAGPLPREAGNSVPAPWINLSVVAGDTDLSTPETRPGHTSPAVEILEHPGGWFFDVYDVALIRLASPLSVPRIRLAGSSDDGLETAGTRLTVAGFYSNPAPSIPNPWTVSDALTYGDVSVVKDGQCKKGDKLSVADDVVDFIAGAQSESDFDPARQLCAGALKHSHCRSGNPLFAGSGSQSVQVGVYSYKLFEEVCGNAPLNPNVYTEINSPDIRNWIRTTAGV